MRLCDGVGFRLWGAGLLSVFLSTVSCSSDETGPTTVDVTADKAFVMVAPPAGHNTTASGVISRDGTVVAGFSGVAPLNVLKVYRWTAAGGPSGRMQWLEPPGVNKDPAALLNIFSIGFSEDASTLMGTMAREKDNALFRWDAANGMTDLGTINGRGLVFTHIDASSDGAVVMATDGQQAFRWTRADGRVSLGQLPDDIGNEAIAMSRDGNVIAGNSSKVMGSVARVFRWTADGGIAAIDLAPNTRACEAKGQMSDDGSILFGVCSPAVGGQPQTLFRWTENSGTEQIFVTQLPYALVMPFGVTDDGSALVGSFAQGSPPLPNAPPATLYGVFRWTAQAGVTPLFPPAELRDCLYVDAMTRDGSVVLAGCSTTGAGSGLVKWNGEGTAVVLAPPAGLVAAKALSVTTDGHIVAGYAEPPGPITDDSIETAVMWDDRGAGPVVVADFLREQGIATDAELAGVQLRSARISRDGHTLIGEAIDPDGRKVSWLARLP